MFRNIVALFICLTVLFQTAFNWFTDYQTPRFFVHVNFVSPLLIPFTTTLLEGSLKSHTTHNWFSPYSSAPSKWFLYAIMFLWAAKEAVTAPQTHNKYNASLSFRGITVQRSSSTTATTLFISSQWTDTHRKEKHKKEGEMDYLKVFGWG